MRFLFQLYAYILTNNFMRLSRNNKAIIDNPFLMGSNYAQIKQLVFGVDGYINEL